MTVELKAIIALRKPLEGRCRVIQIARCPLCNTIELLTLLRVMAVPLLLRLQLHIRELS